MLIFTFVIATVASLIPVLGAARLRVVDTLRYEWNRSGPATFAHKGMKFAPNDCPETAS
jgi:hypothetical protein